MPMNNIILIAVMLIWPRGTLRIDVEDIGCELEDDIEMLDSEYYDESDDNYQPRPDGEEYRLSREDFEDETSKLFPQQSGG